MKCKIFFCFLSLVWGVSFTQVQAHDVPPRPASGFIYDETDSLSASASSQVLALSQQLQQETQINLGVVLIYTNGEEPLKTFAQQVYHEWQMGDEAVLLVLAKDDHKSDIWVTGEIDQVLTETVTQDLQSQQLFPVLAQENYSVAAERFAQAVLALAQTNTASVATKNAFGTPAIITTLVFGLGLTWYYRRRRQRKNSS